MGITVKEKDLEKVVLAGLEIESIEKVKAAERKCLTRKNGLQMEKAVHNDGTVGQTRDIVARELNISGRHWDRMKFIFQSKAIILEQDYLDWRCGKLSTTTLYNKTKKECDRKEKLKEIYISLKLLEEDLYDELRRDRLGLAKGNLEYDLYNQNKRIKVRVFQELQDVDCATELRINNNIKKISKILDQVNELKRMM